MILLLEDGVAVCVSGYDVVTRLGEPYPVIEGDGIFLQWDDGSVTHELLEREVLLKVRLPDEVLSHLIDVGQNLKLYKEASEGCYKSDVDFVLNRDNLLRAQGAWGIIARPKT